MQCSSGEISPSYSSWRKSPGGEWQMDTGHQVRLPDTKETTDLCRCIRYLHESSASWRQGYGTKTCRTSFAILWITLLNFTKLPRSKVDHQSMVRSDHLSIIKLYLVGGLVAIFYFPRNIGNTHPNWLSYFSEGWPNHQPGIIMYHVRDLENPSRGWVTNFPSCPTWPCQWPRNQCIGDTYHLQGQKKQGYVAMWGNITTKYCYDT